MISVVLKFLTQSKEDVDSTLSRVRSGASRETITTVRVELNRSLERIDSALCAISGQNLSALGALPRARSASEGGVVALRKSRLRFLV